MRLSPLNVNLAVDFFAAQPQEAFRFFRPHGFDQSSLLRLCRNKGFLAFLVMQEDRVVGTSSYEVSSQVSVSGGI